MKKRLSLVLIFVLVLIMALSSCTVLDTLLAGNETNVPSVSLDSIPEFDGTTPYVVINDNTPFFTDEEYTLASYEKYSELDNLGRCGAAMSCVGIDLMPEEDRGSIGSVKPSGWKSRKYDIVDGKYLYNRCHLIGYQLTGENANEKNLITGTRYMNVKGMLPFENMVADYVKETENHVLMRVTPIFSGDELVARGVLMEAKSVEDNGEGILFCVYIYNCQPGIVINYEDGESRLASEPESDEKTEDEGELSEITYILNLSSKKFHKPSCSGANSMKDENRAEYYGTREDAIADGYDPCGTCNP